MGVRRRGKIKGGIKTSKSQKKPKPQCKQNTLHGERCQRVAIKDGLCTIHYNQLHGIDTRWKNSEQCKGINYKGERCGMQAQIAGYCTRHLHQIPGRDSDE